MNVIKLDEDGQVTNFIYAQQRATDYIREYCDPKFTAVPKWKE